MKKLLLIGLFFFIFVLPIGYSTNPINQSTHDNIESNTYDIVSHERGLRAFYQKIRKLVSHIKKWIKESILDDSLQIGFVLLIISLLCVAGLFILSSSSLSVTFLVLLLVSVVCFVGALIAFMYHFFS